MGKVLSLVEAGKIEFKEYEERKLKSNEIRVKTIYSGVSAGTELTTYRGFNPHINKSWNSKLRIFENSNTKKSRYPVDDWGYEEVGKIIELGSEVDALELGDIIYGTWGHKTTAILDQEFALNHKLEADMETIYGIFSHIGSIALNSVLDADIHVGETTAVFGQGVPGQIVTQLAKLNGAEVIALDLDDKRLDIAKNNGADVVLNPNNCQPGKKIKELTGGRGADVAIEISGSLQALHQAIKATTYSGKTIASGFFSGNMKGLKLGEEFHHNRIQLICSQISGLKPELNYRWDRLRLNHTIMDLQDQDKLDLKGLITHWVDFEDAIKAFEMLEKGEEDCLQLVLKFD